MSSFYPEPIVSQQPSQPQHHQFLIAYDRPQQPPLQGAPYAQPQQPGFAPVQPPQGYTPPQPSAAYTVASEREGRPWVVAVLGGLLVGAVAAFAYASLSFLVGREVLALVMAIGGVIGLVVRKLSWRPGMPNGVIATLLAVPATLAAGVLLIVFSVTDSIPEGLSVLGDVNYGVAVQAYFSNALSYVWFGASVVVAFFIGARVNSSLR